MRSRESLPIGQQTMVRRNSAATNLRTHCRASGLPGAAARRADQSSVIRRLRNLAQYASLLRPTATDAKPASIASPRHSQKFLAGQRVVAKAAQHAAGDEIGVQLVHAARGHAMMRGLDDDADA